MQINHINIININILLLIIKEKTSIFIIFHDIVDINVLLNLLLNMEDSKQMEEESVSAPPPPRDPAALQLTLFKLHKVK